MTDVGCWKRLLFIPIAVFVFAGCGSGSSVTVYPVKGKVTFEDKPLPGGGSIAFIPQGSNATVDAGGEIMPDGTYELSTTNPGDGAMAGEFRVVVTQTVFKEPDGGEDGKAVTSEATAIVAEADRIPAIYSDYEKSPLTAKVEAKSNELNFNLKRK